MIWQHHGQNLCARNQLEFSAEAESDCASLNELIVSTINLGEIKFKRDTTRLGLATILGKLAEKHRIGIVLDEKSIPVRENVKGLCEIFGYDPLYMANEGKVVMIVSSDDANAILKSLKNNKHGENAAIIGEITQINSGRVILNTGIGGSRIIDMHTGEQLPRIC